MSFVWIFILEIILAFMQPKPVIGLNDPLNGDFVVYRDGSNVNDTIAKDIWVGEFKIRRKRTP